MAPIRTEGQSPGRVTSGSAPPLDSPLASISSELDGTNGFRIDGEAGDYSGAVAGAGDFNGDGFADVVIGAAAAAPGGRERAGSSYIVFGSNAGFPAVLDLGELGGSDGFRIDGIAAFDRSGNGVAGAGDVNADGLDDLIIVAPDGGYAGEAYVIYGFRTGPTPPIVGGPGPDDLTGTPGEDRMFGRAGDDQLAGLAATTCSTARPAATSCGAARATT